MSIKKEAKPSEKTVHVELEAKGQDPKEAPKTRTVIDEYLRLHDLTMNLPDDPAELPYEITVALQKILDAKALVQGWLDRANKP